MYECTHIRKLLVHLTYDIREVSEQMERDEKAEVPGITIANDLSSTGENKERTVVRRKPS